MEGLRREANAGKAEHQTEEMKSNRRKFTNSPLYRSEVYFLNVDLRLYMIDPLSAAKRILAKAVSGITVGYF